jgi:RHS repeat-associated protein
LIEETYPSGRVVKNTLDVDGDLAQVQSKKLNGTFQNYANAFTYTSAGAVSSLRLGNGKFENTTFNSRLQPIQIGLGSSATSQNLLKLNFDYGGSDNNGNVKSQQISVQQGNPTPLVLNQNYVYDSLNRLKSAEEKDANNIQVWKQTYVFDRYGNRTFDAANTTTLDKNCGTLPNKFVCTNDIAKFNPTANLGDNKLVGTNYDAVGNTIQDAEGRRFGYDAENKQVKYFASTNQSTTPNGTYFFDGDGKRVKKISPTETTIFVYDAGGKLVAEYSTQQADTPKINYTTNDHLGSPRITTDQNGQVISRTDYQPYGEEIASTQRTANLGYTVQDSVKQGFTGYIKDDETGLDFAQARMYQSGLGRFTSVDPLMASAVVTNAQTWNRYTYVGNNPLNYIDPTGKNYEDLQGKRKQLIDDYYAKEAKKQNKTVAEIYNGLKDDQKLHFEGITNALEKTKVFDAKGKDTGKNALDLIKSIDIGKLDAKGNPNAIRGLDSSGEGAESYRIFVTYDTDAIKSLGSSDKNFDESSAGQHPGMEGGFREKGKPSIQLNYDPTKSNGDIDIDFKHGTGGVLLTIVTLGNKGALSVDNSNINTKNNRKAYEEKYGKIPRKK